MHYFWEKNGWIQEDRHLRALHEAPFQRPFPSLVLEEGLYLIRGPRQVGKSSWLKTLLAQAPDPSRAFYLSCEGLESHQELTALLNSLRGKRDLILLDEVSFVRDWTRAIKHELDSGFRGSLVVTGSHAADLKRGADQLPGRFGKGGEYHLLPMSFQEVQKMREMAGWPVLSMMEAFRAYFRTGGFPSAVIEGGPEGKSPVVAKDTYRRWLSGDAIRLGKQEIYLREILSQLALTACTPISLQKLAQRTQIGSHHTAMDYVSILESCFALRTCYALDPDTSALRIKKEKKFYFTDPLIYWIALEWAGFPSPANAEECLAETVAFESLFRHYSAKFQRFGYYSSPSGEIDFFCPKRWAIEVKWAPVPGNLSRAFKSLLIPEKLVWTQQNFLEKWPAD